MSLDTILLLILTIVELYLVTIERSVKKTMKASLILEEKTYEMYRAWIETTEKRKADSREKAAATRAAKRLIIDIPPGTLPPPMVLEEESNSETEEATS